MQAVRILRTANYEQMPTLSRFRPILHRPGVPGSPVWLGLFLSMGLTLTTTSIQALQITGLAAPASFVGDPTRSVYFISNINGEPDAKDNNGFITKLNGEGQIVAFKFIRGGENGVTLHAPKGMAVVDHTLYVADVDVVRAFADGTGAPLHTIPFPRPTPSGTQLSLMDIVADGNGLLYVSDQKGNAIYTINPKHNHAVAVFLHDARLAGPSGLAIHPKSGHLIAVSWDQGSIVDIAPEGTLEIVASNSFFSSRFRNLRGADFDRWGNLYVSDLTSGKIWRMLPNKRFHVIAEYLPSPADISIDRENNLILVPYEYSDAAEVNGLESPIDPSGRKRKRTLADYGFIAPPKLDQEPPTR